MNNDDEIWAYDEPHESGGNCHVTMTRRQAIEWMRKMHPFQYCGPVPDNTVFFDWMAVHWAYRSDPEKQIGELALPGEILLLR